MSIGGWSIFTNVPCIILRMYHEKDLDYMETHNHSVALRVSHMVREYLLIRLKEDPCVKDFEIYELGLSGCDTSYLYGFLYPRYDKHVLENYEYLHCTTCEDMHIECIINDHNYQWIRVGRIRWRYVGLMDSGG